MNVSTRTSPAATRREFLNDDESVADGDCVRHDGERVCTGHGRRSGDTCGNWAPVMESLVYVPGGGEATVDLAAPSGPVALEWFNPRC